MEITNETIYEFKCPHCHTTLEEDNCYDMSCEGDYVTRKIEGYCPNCGKIYFWIETYEFNGVTNLREGEN